MKRTRIQRVSKPEKRNRRPSVSGPTRERLLEVAGPIFADRGYRAATIREISTAAKENVAAVHYHFGDKLGLYTQVVLHSAKAAHVEAIRSALDQNAPPEEILRAVIRARLGSLSRRDLPEWHFRILMHEMAEPTPALRQILDKVGRPLFTRLLELIGGMLGLAPDDDKTRLCAISVMGQILAYVFAAPMLAGVWPELKMTPAQVERIAEHIGDFSLSYIRGFRTNAPARSVRKPARATDNTASNSKARSRTARPRTTR
jgi:TetR/AcrR family transcriptional regulator, regulator of cefoperazone and chloramphenicol sensitivity